MVVVAVGLNPPASSERVAATWSTMPSLKLVTNLICTLLASGAFCRVQNALIVCRGVSLEDHNQAQYRNSNWKTRGERKAKFGADADNVYNDQTEKAEALTQDHQCKLSFHNISLLLARGNKGCSILLPHGHGHSLKPKLLAWPKRQNHAPVNGIIVKGHDLWVSFLRITFPITPNMEENICFH